MKYIPLSGMTHPFGLPGILDPAQGLQQPGTSLSNILLPHNYLPLCQVSLPPLFNNRYSSFYN